MNIFCNFLCLVDFRICTDYIVLDLNVIIGNKKKIDITITELII